MRIHLPFVAPVRGVSFHQSAVAAVRPGDPVQIDHETDNPADPDAVVVRSAGGDVLGYLPAAVAHMVVASFGCSARLRGVVDATTGIEIAGVRVKVTGLRESPTGTARVVSPSGAVLGTVAGYRDGVVLVDTGVCVVPYPVGVVSVSDSAQ